MTRWLKYLLPKDGEKNNTAEWVQWIISIAFIIIMIYVIQIGVKAIKYQYIRVKRGREFHGSAAQTIGIFYVLLGIATILIIIYVKFNGPLITN
jgi:hypothetical protein